MSSLLDHFADVWCVDFEFYAPPGSRPEPICVVATNVRSGHMYRLWADDLACLSAPPFACLPTSVMVAYYASAELGCYRQLGWPFPAYVLDLYAEFRCLTNGRTLPAGRGLLGALTYFGLETMGAVEKEDMRQLAIRGGPWTGEERTALLEYCAGDVDALCRLLPCLLPHIDLSAALLRGRYMRAAACMEDIGVPIDVPQLRQLREAWGSLQTHLVREIATQFDVYDGESFSLQRFEQWLERRHMFWPRLDSGQLDLKDETFREMSRMYPVVEPLRQVRHALSQLRLEELAVGPDGRNRCLLSAFQAKTGRNAPSTTRFVFGPSVWLRHLIRPTPEIGLAYIDWEQQEFGIAAALSGDERMLEAYQSGDPYLAFARQAQAIPASATKKTHGAVREFFKQCALAVQYGMGCESLTHRIQRSPAHAAQLLRAHRELYATFWQWSEAHLDFVARELYTHSVFGWYWWSEGPLNPRALLNFPMQANGAEMLRLACCLATERGVRVCAPVHDAVLIEAPVRELEVSIDVMRRSMAEASRVVLDGLALRTEATCVFYPLRYRDPRGKIMWDMVQRLLQGRTGPCDRVRVI